MVVRTASRLYFWCWTYLMPFSGRQGTCHTVIEVFYYCSELFVWMPQVVKKLAISWYQCPSDDDGLRGYWDNSGQVYSRSGRKNPSRRRTSHGKFKSGDSWRESWHDEKSAKSWKHWLCGQVFSSFSEIFPTKCTKKWKRPKSTSNSITTKNPATVEIAGFHVCTPDWIRTSDLQSGSNRNVTTRRYEIITNKQAKRRWWSGNSRFRVNAVLICAILCVMCPIVHVAWGILRMGRSKACNCATIVV